MKKFESLRALRYALRPPAAVLPLNKTPGARRDLCSLCCPIAGNGEMKGVAVRTPFADYRNSITELHQALGS